MLKANYDLCLRFCSFYGVMRRSTMAACCAAPKHSRNHASNYRYAFTFVLHVDARAGTQEDEFALSISFICA